MMNYNTIIEFGRWIYVGRGLLISVCVKAHHRGLNRNRPEKGKREKRLIKGGK